MAKKLKNKVVSVVETPVQVESAKPSEIVHRDPDELKPYPGNARVHSDHQIEKLMAAIREFGFRGVITTNEESTVLSGHGRLEAAKRLKLKTVPTLVATGLTKKQQKAFVLADNKLALMSTWDDVQLKTEIELLLVDDFNIETTGFSTAEIDIMLDDSPPPANDPGDLQPEDVVEKPVTRPGDIWRMRDHTLSCGNSLEGETYGSLLNEESAQMIITDPPYNVKIQGNVCGSGKVKHDEFAMASSEMGEGEFTDFLGKSYAHMNNYLDDGGIIYSFMDWRHQRHILNAAEPIWGPLRQLCVWVKKNGGMGTFYRSQHELVYVFKKGDVPHINNFELGQFGRYRTNVWHYDGVNSFKGHHLLKLHPTVKPVGMIADAIRDCSNRNDIVLDPFAGSGTILIAAERTGRRARAIELDPKYVDVAIRRWQRVTGESAVIGFGPDRITFDEMAMLRNPPPNIAEIIEQNTLKDDFYEAVEKAEEEARHGK